MGRRSPAGGSSDDGGGSIDPSQVVTKIIAGNNVTISPSTGVGDVTISSTEEVVVTVILFTTVLLLGVILLLMEVFDKDKTAQLLKQLLVLKGFCYPNAISQLFSCSQTTLNVGDNCYTANQTETGFDIFTSNNMVEVMQILLAQVVFSLPITNNAVPPEGGTGADAWAQVEVFTK